MKKASPKSNSQPSSLPGNFIDASRADQEGGSGINVLLKGSQNEFSFLFRNTPVILSISAIQEGVYLEVSDAWCLEMGYTRQEVLGRTSTELNIFVQPEQRNKILAELNAKGRILNQELEFRIKSGIKLPYLVSIIPVQMNDQACILSILQNSSARKQLEITSQENEIKFRTLFENSRDAICLSKAGMHAYVNPAYLALFGYASDVELTGRPLIELTAPGSRPLIQDFIRLRFEGKEVPNFFETRGLRKDGSEFDMEIKTSTYELQGERYNLSLIRDVSERKRAETILRFTQFVVDHIGDAAYWLRPDGYLIYANEATCQSLGYSWEELQRLHITDIVPRFTREDWTNHWPELKRDGTQAFESFHKTRTGEVFPVEVRTSFIQFEDQEFACVLTHDISERTQAEKALAESQELLHSIVESTDDLIWAVDSNLLGLLSFNHAFSDYFLDYLGVHVAIGMRPEDLFQTDDLIQRWYGLYHRVLREGPFATEYEMSTSGRTLQISLNLLKREGVVFGVSVSTKDITEIKRTEKAEREHAANLLRILEATSSGTWDWNIQTGKTVFSAQIAKDLGYEPAEFVKDFDSWTKLVHPEDIVRVRQAQSDQITRNKEYSIEFRMREKSGGWHWIHSRGILIERDSEGRPVRMVGTHYDIQERKQVEEALHENEELFRTSFENASVGICLLSPEGKFYRVNDQLCNLLGYSREELIQLTFDDVTHPEDKEIGSLAIKHLIAGDIENTNFEKRYIHKDGHILWVFVSCGVVRNQAGQVQYTVGYNQDITDRKKAELDLARQNEELIHLYSQTDQRLQDLISLRTVDAAIAGSFDIQFILEILLTQAMKRLGIEIADILIFNPATGSFRLSAARGFRQEVLESFDLHQDQPLARQILHGKQVITIDNLTDEMKDLLWAGEIAHEGFDSYMGIPLITKDQIRGVLEIYQNKKITLDQEQLDFVDMLAKQAAIAIDSTQLFENLQSSNQELKMAYDETIEGWSQAMDLRDKDTEGHSQRVAALTVKLAGLLGVNSEELVHIRRGALLHDMGKIGIPDEILHKTGAFTAEEWRIMRQHPQLAYDLLSSITYLLPAIDIPYCHHEKWDGTGYPRGLKGEQIPLAARIFAVVDVWDALTSDRSYRKAWPREEALAYIREQSGKHFDPRMVDLFLKEIS